MLKELKLKAFNLTQLEVYGKKEWFRIQEVKCRIMVMNYNNKVEDAIKQKEYSIDCYDEYV